MPPKKSSSTTSVKTESPSRRKVGRPKKVEVEEAVPEDVVEEPEEVVETPSPAPKKRGRKKAKPALSAPAEEEEGDEMTTVVTLNMEDLIDMPADIAAVPTPTKKRKAPAKSSATKKSKSDSSMLKDAGGGGDVENLIQCSLCDAKVVQLVRHIRAQHGDDPDYDTKIKEARSLEAKVQSIATPKKQTTNNLLDDLTITVGKMERPQIVDRRTTGERGNSLVRPKNTQCPICEKVVRRYDLNKHIRNVHSGEKPNKCPYCEYASPWKGNLNTHIAGVHTKARLHDCIRCGLSFKTRSAMIGHVRKVHDKMYQPKERLFECEECNKRFYKKFHLQRHIRVHTGEKPFTCAFCEKMFASKTNMDSHIQSVHLKIKPFKCGYCEKGFARKKMMLIHIRKYHMNKDDANMLGMSSIDDITLDDHLDGDSDDGSVESGEILAGEDGMPDGGMMLVKMRDDDMDGDIENMKQYMFVPTEGMHSDLDNTLDSSADYSSMLTPNRSMSSHHRRSTSRTPKTITTHTPSGITKTTIGKEPVVINVGAGQVVQAVQTKDGIMLVTQPAPTTSPSKSKASPAPAAVLTPAPAAADIPEEPAQQTATELLPTDEPANEVTQEDTTTLLSEEQEPSEQVTALVQDKVTVDTPNQVTADTPEQVTAVAPEQVATEAPEQVTSETPEQVTAELVEQTEEPVVEQPVIEQTDPIEQTPVQEVENEAAVVSQEAEEDLVQQALAETVPEGVAAKTILNTDTDLMGGLPANLLATEEIEHTETTNGEKTTVETYFLTDLQTNGE